MQERITFARSLASCLSGVEVQLLKRESEEFWALVRKSIYARIPGFQEKTVSSFLDRLERDALYTVSGMLDLSYGLILHEGVLLCIGPCLCDGFSESRIRTHLRDFHLSGSAVEQLVSSFRHIPVISRESLRQATSLLGEFLLGLHKVLPMQTAEFQWAAAQLPTQSEEEQEREISYIRMVESRYEASAMLTEAVKQGNFSLAYEFIQHVRPEEAQMARNPNVLRNTQNMCIVLNTQLRHALEDCGIHPYRLDTVSGRIGTEIEKLRSAEAAASFCAEIVRRYCELALEKNYVNLNRLTRQAVIYVKNHLADNVTVKDTAAALQVNANYLSGLFRKETGMTFIAFLNKERAAQAAAFLRRTDMPIRRIAASVGYNNTSYFARQFAVYYGCSPKEYRLQGRP